MVVTSEGHGDVQAQSHYDALITNQIVNNVACRSVHKPCMDLPMLLQCIHYRKHILPHAPMVNPSTRSFMVHPCTHATMRPCRRWPTPQAADPPSPGPATAWPPYPPGTPTRPSCLGGTPRRWLGIPSVACPRQRHGPSVSHMEGRGMKSSMQMGPHPG